ncbi:hypothetical protein [Bosea sp. BK604]|uniref:hypothetical protein n=1 Tax=Bosea sp. BK604 TaxID=2512180 RepID=UPI001052363D|nr:hypothetical protein [Bosea sp. BK604]TCR62624.1 hypothetical protein EV560_110169 [Bosea sp. BK604]
MSDVQSLRSSIKTTASYGPFRLLEAVPWLMLASSMRFVAYGGGVLAIPAIIVANLALLLAFIIVVWRMVRFSGGRSGLGELGLRDQLAMARTVLLPVFGMLALAAALASLSGGFVHPHVLMLGFDAIAFDQVTDIGRLWSAIVAAVMLIMVLQVDGEARPSLWRALRELAWRWRRLVPAIAMVTAAHMLLHPVQGVFRRLVYEFMLLDGVSNGLKLFAYFSFVFSFASIRLWLTIAILVLALRRSHQQLPPR